MPESAVAIRSGPGPGAVRKAVRAASASASPGASSNCRLDAAVGAAGSVWRASRPIRRRGALSGTSVPIMQGARREHRHPTYEHGARTVLDCFFLYSNLCGT